MIVRNLADMRMKQALKWGLGLTLFLRVGLGLIMGSVWLTLMPYLQPVVQQHPNLYSKLTVPTQFPGNVLLTVWVRWDAVHHLNLASRGYFDLSEGDSVFYPLFAVITRLLTNIFRFEIITSGLITATIFTCIALTLLFLIAETAFDIHTAKWSVIVLALFPTSFFLLAPFTESLFLALTLGAFLCASQKKWELTGYLGFLASLTRGPGILTSLALIFIAWRQWQVEKYPLFSKTVVRMVLGLGLPPLGGLVFLFWRKINGFPSVSTVLEKYSHLVMTNPISGLINAVKLWFGNISLTNSLDLGVALLFILLTGLMVKKFYLIKPEWCVYTVINLALFLSKQGFVTSPLQSIPRYILILFPIFIFLGHWIAKKSDPIRYLYISCSIVGLVVLSACYSLWIFIG